MSRFSDVKWKPPLRTDHMRTVYDQDRHPDKVNLFFSTLRDGTGQDRKLPCVRTAERQLAEDPALDKECLPESFTGAAVELLLGAGSAAVREKRAWGAQTPAGNGALRVAAELLAKELGCGVFYYSKPTDKGQKLAFFGAGFEEGRGYRYWCRDKQEVNIRGLLLDLKAAPKDSVVIFHMCSYYPSGCDPTKEQWMQIADVVRDKGLFPVFDCGHQGLNQNLEEDAWVVRHFADNGFEFLCAQSFAENFAMFQDGGVGNLTFVHASAETVESVRAAVATIVRGTYRNPPSHGARTIARILKNPELRGRWREGVGTMADRFAEARKLLKDALEKRGTPGDWEHLTEGRGMYAYAGLSDRQARHVTTKFHIYTMDSGCINLRGVGGWNVDYVADAVHDAVSNVM